MLWQNQGWRLENVSRDRRVCRPVNDRDLFDGVVEAEFGFLLVELFDESAGNVEMDFLHTSAL